MRKVAYRPRKQTKDHIYVIRSTERDSNKQKAKYLAFLDLAAAFNSVPKTNTEGFNKDRNSMKTD